MNPKNFKVIDGKLYLSWSKEGSNKFADNASNNIENAEANWIKVSVKDD